jgi:membrane protein EpsK
MEKSNLTFDPIQNIRNITSNLIIFAFNLVISLWYTPFLIRNLGSELFGFIPLATSTINFLGIITLSLNTSAGRFLTIEIGKNNTKRANQVFNTTLVGSLILISSTIPIAVGLVLLVPKLFNVPLNYIHHVQYLFIGTILGFFITALRSNFSVAAFVKNRFDLRNLVSLVARIGQIVIIVFLFRIYSPSLLHISISVVALGFLSFIGDFYLWKRLLPDLKVNLYTFRRKLMDPLLSTSLWVFFHEIGSIIFLNTEMLVANRTLTLGIAGMYGALLVIPKNIRIVAQAVGSVWGPSLLTKFSRSDFSGMDKVVRYAVKLTGFTIALPIGGLIGMARPFLVIWLGPEYEVMTWVLVVMICHLSVNLISSPFLNVQVTLNKMTLPAITSLVLGILNVILAVILSRSIGAMGIVFAGALTLTLNNFVFKPIYAAKIMGRKWWHYIQILLPIIATTLGVGLISYSSVQILRKPSLIKLLTMGVAISCIYLPIAYRIGLSENERGLVLEMLIRMTSGIPVINRVLKRFIPKDQSIDGTNKES